MADQTTTTRDDLTGPEQAAVDAWTRGSADTTGMLYAVRHALAAAGPTIAADAHDRLARHLYIEGCALDDLAAKRWDGGAVDAARMDDYREAADRALTAIAGQDT